ncbi:chloride channel protein [Pseudonocardia xishanensis]|uniref:Chloride channel protein n=1 Tax=Pseudonocardia xishanensis TaxID=630995 RepID=A0ABP8RYM3_9PSEU
MDRTAPSTAGDPTRTPDPAAVLRSRRYVGLLVLAALTGVPVSVAAYWFLRAVDLVQAWVYTDLPGALGLRPAPLWWPVPPLVLAGLLVGAVIRYLPGRGGHSPVDGFAAGGVPDPRNLPGVVLAALAGLGLGVVLGPEAPLIAVGGGLGVLAVRLARRDAPRDAAAVMAAAGSFAAISALLGSPIVGAFLLMEASMSAGAALGVVLLPGLLAAGVGSLVFLGLGTLTGVGTTTLALPDLPAYTHPDAAQFGWAVVAGLAAALLGGGIRRLAVLVRPHAERRTVTGAVVVGLAVALLAIGYALVTGHPTTDVLFSGQSGLEPLLVGSAGYSVPALLVLIACKGIGYGLCMAALRGGPVFPAILLGAAGGLALSHLPGLPLVAGVAIGIGAMCAVMLRLPMTSVLLPTLLLFSDGIAVMPLVIVAVVVAHVAAARLAPRPPRSPAPGEEPGNGRTPP